MHRCYLLFIFLLTLGCDQAEKKSAVADITGTYAMEVASHYGITRDTILVKAQSVRDNLYFITHKIRFIKKLNGTDTTYRFVTTTHLATFEEHLGQLQDINDGTLFRLYHEEETANNTAHYRKIN